MDMLTTAADAILSPNTAAMFNFSPNKVSRSPFSNITNIRSPRQCFSDSSFTSLLTGKIKPLETPRKRKNGSKYQDENKPPSPKTPKTTRRMCMGDKSKKSPFTPTSNLKLLTRIASMEEPITKEDKVAHIHKHKSTTKNSIQNYSKTSLSTESEEKIKFTDINNSLTSNKFAEVQSIPRRKVLRRSLSENISLTQKKSETKNSLKRHPTTSDARDNVKETIELVDDIHAVDVSRKDKSLGVLCERFLEHFPLEVSFLETPRRLIVDDVAVLLGTERRRVYDIVNILECLNMASRIQKNMYQWMGTQHLTLTLSKLKTLAIRLKINQPSTVLNSRNKITPASEIDAAAAKIEARKDKSLGVLCQKFLMLFLATTPPQTLMLDTALHLLLDTFNEPIEKKRTKGRRLYDIANVLSALKLVQKIPQSRIFQYIGPHVDPILSQENVPLSINSLIRHSLLPPPTIDILPDCHSDKVTPSDIPVQKSKKAKPRILVQEFQGGPRAKRNCLMESFREVSVNNLSSRTDCKENQTTCSIIKGTKAEDGHMKFQAKSLLTRHPSLQDICEVAELEREKLMKEENMRNAFRNKQQAYSMLQEKVPLRFSIGNMNGPKLLCVPVQKFTSPRVALTFAKGPFRNGPEQSGQRSPPALTSQPPKVHRPPLIYHTVNVQSNGASPVQNINVANGVRPIYLIQSGQTSGVANSHEGLQERRSVFKICQRKDGGCDSKLQPLVRSLSDSMNITNGVWKKSINSSQSACPPMQVQSAGPKLLIRSKTVMPSVNLNTVAKNHYKVGGHSLSTKSSSFTNLLDAKKSNTFHFVINNQTPTVADDEKKTQTFIKMFHPSPDSSSTDSELEGIFGDSFNFTRPKNLSNSSTK